MRIFPSYRAVVVAAALTWCGTAFAQTPAPTTTAGEDIVVTGSKSPTGASNTAPMVVTGSRIERTSLQHSPNIASATSFGGLQSDSGLDAGKSSRTLRIKSCRVTGASLSKQTACALLPVQKAYEQGDYAKARALISSVASLPDQTIEDRFVVESYRYRIAEALSDTAGVRTALAAIVETDFLPVDEQIAALRKLATLARRAGDSGEVLTRYRQIIALDPTDVPSRINAGVVLQELGQNEAAKAEFRTGIRMARQTGQTVLASWEENAR